MAAYYSRKVKMSFQEALDKVEKNLQLQGFGIITSIDLKDTFKKKMNLDFRNYKILGACNPQFAYQAISLESHLGVMLPCNIVVQEHENGEVEVSAVNPLETVDKSLRTTQVAILATEVGNRLRYAIDTLDHNHPEKSTDALPTEQGPVDYQYSIQG